MKDHERIIPNTDHCYPSNDKKNIHVKLVFLTEGLKVQHSMISIDKILHKQLLENSHDGCRNSSRNDNLFSTRNSCPPLLPLNMCCLLNRVRVSPRESTCSRHEHDISPESPCSIRNDIIKIKFLLSLF